MCYFRALQKGDINKVVPIDKSSTVLTILLALIFLHEGVTAGKLFSVVLIGLGTMLMITRKNSQRADTGQTETHWLLYAVLSAVFASLTGLDHMLNRTGNTEVSVGGHGQRNACDQDRQDQQLTGDNGASI